MKKLLLILFFVLPSVFVIAQKSCNFVALNQVEIKDNADTTISGYFRINDYLLVDGAVKFDLKAQFNPSSDFKFVKLYWDSLCNQQLMDLTQYVLPNEQHKVEGSFSYIFPDCDITYRIFLKFRLFNNTSFVFPLNVKLRTTVSIKSNTEDFKLDIFPNPVINTLTIKANTQRIYIKRLYNLQGELLVETIDNKIDFSNYSMGIYFLETMGKMHKIIKQ